jgi:hypothetical protein
MAELPSSSQRRVTSFNARVGWQIDALTLKFSDGSRIDYGGESGDPVGPWQLGGNEFLVAVEQTNANAGYLGSCIAFETSQGRYIELKRRPKKRKGCSRFEATAGHHVVGLSFTGSRLVGIDEAYNENVALLALVAPCSSAASDGLQLGGSSAASPAAGVLDNSVEAPESLAAGEGLEVTREDAGGVRIPPPPKLYELLAASGPSSENDPAALERALDEEAMRGSYTGLSTMVEVDVFSRDLLLQTYTIGFELLCKFSETGNYTKREGMKQEQRGVVLHTFEKPRFMAGKKQTHESADKRRENETEEAFDFRASRAFERPVKFHKEGSSTIVVGHSVPKDGWDKPVMPVEALRFGALTFKECQQWLDYHLLPQELHTLLAVLPRCRAQLAFLRHDEASGLKRPKPCKYKNHCKHPHPVSAADVYGEIEPEQLAWHLNKHGSGKGFDLLPCGSLARCKIECEPSGAIKWQVKPPAKEALLKYLAKFGLSDLVKDVRLMESDTDEPTVWIELQGMRTVDPFASESSKNSVMNLGNSDEKINASGKAVREFAYHATDPRLLVPILQSRALKPGDSDPKAIFLVEHARTSNASMYNQGMVVQCRVRGFPWNWDKYSWATDYTIPPGTYAWLRQVSNERQIACHESGVEVVAVMMRTKLLFPVIDDELEKLGYTARYHNTAQELLNRALNRVERSIAK